jgi:hypothetical protein
MTDEPSYDDCPDRGNVESFDESFNWPKWSEDYERRRELEQQKRSREFRTEILPRLQALGIEKVVGGYSGYGDSGDLHDLNCVGPGGNPVAIDDTLRKECVDFLYEFLPDGYEINEGGQGDITLNLQTMRIELEHQENIIETKGSYEEYDV